MLIMLTRLYQYRVNAMDLDFEEKEHKLGPTSPQQPPPFQRDPRDPNIGRSVIITSGHFKGYKGTIKESNTVLQKAYVELSVFGSRSLNFAFSHLADER